MSTLATVLLAWAAVYAYLCAYHVTLYWRRRSEREYLAFGLLTGGFAIIAVSNALHVDATSFAESSFALRIGSVGLSVAAAFYVDFAGELTGRRSNLRGFAYAWAVVGLALEVAGLGIDTAPESPTWRWGGLHAPSPRTTIFGQIHVAVLWATTSIATYPLVRQLRAPALLSELSPAPARLLVLSALVGIVAALHDLAIRLGVLRAPTLLDHAGILFVFAMSYALLDRFVRASEELRGKTAELAQAYEELRQTQERLVRKEQLAAVGELSAVIAHEVRNPLAVIKNSVSGLRRRVVSDADRATLLDILDEETDRLNRLVHDLLAYAQPVVPKGRELVVRDLTRRVLDRALSGIAHAELVHIEWHLDGPETVHGDPELLRHALVNVVENALQAMPSGGTLTVRSEAADLDGKSALALSFADTGEGMDTIVRAKARNPFFTTRPSGTGLGLAIVDRVVRNHGGRVEIDSKHGAGTTIRLVLPRERTSLVPIPVGESGEGRLSAIREVSS
jgi:signal transduction histidine kinase